MLVLNRAIRSAVLSISGCLFCWVAKCLMLQPYLSPKTFHYFQWVTSSPNGEKRSLFEVDFDTL